MNRKPLNPYPRDRYEPDNGDGYTPISARIPTENQPPLTIVKENQNISKNHDMTVDQSTNDSGSGQTPGLDLSEGLILVKENGLEIGPGTAFYEYKYGLFATLDGREFEMKGWFKHIFLREVLSFEEPIDGHLVQVTKWVTYFPATSTLEIVDPVKCAMAGTDLTPTEHYMREITKKD